MKKGIDTLALPKYWELIKEELPKDWYYSSFMRTFGDARKAILEVASAKRAGGFRGQAIWEDDHTYDALKHDKEILRCLNFHNNLKQKYPELDVQFSFFCEHNIKGDPLKRIVEKCLKEARGITIVNCIWQGDLIKDGTVINEIHGNKHKVPKGIYNFSYDGEEMRDRNVPEDLKKYIDANIFFAWTSWCNGKWTIAKDETGKQKDNTPREKRIDYLDVKKLDGIINLMTTKGETKLDAKVIYKVFSDDHGIKKKDHKANKPVILAPRGKVIKLVTDDGQVVHKFQPPLAYKEGGIRAYATEFGFEIASKARRIQGHPIVNVMIDKKIVGRIHPAHRENGWR